MITLARRGCNGRRKLRGVPRKKGQGTGWVRGGDFTGKKSKDARKKFGKERPS